MRHVKIKGFAKEIVDQINHARLQTKLYLPSKLVDAGERLRTKSFDDNNNKSQFKWKFKFPKVKKTGVKAMKSWDPF